ncbi:MAG: hypothetical protein RLZZ416_517 [Candidatus Parcubacteria bacterium]|jgi:ABC-type oligopeptide transport system substrate-binding subunit
MRYVESSIRIPVRKASAILAAIVAAIFFASFAFAAPVAHAQARTQAAPRVTAPFPPSPPPPFGYGGGPQKPQTLTGRTIVNQIFQRLNDLFQSIFSS